MSRRVNQEEQSTIKRENLTLSICHFRSLWLRSCPSAKAIHNFSVGESVRILCYHPRYLLSTIEASQKQYWLAINNRNNIRVIDTLGKSFF